MKQTKDASGGGNKMFLGLLGLGVVGGGAVMFLMPEPEAAEPPIHWHMPISYEFCGQPFTPEEKNEHGPVHGHSDGKAHVEGVKPADKWITLDKFMEAIGLEFASDKIYTYKNGDICPGSETPGKVKVLIDGQENTEFGDHVLSDGENIKIIFE